MLIRGLWYAGMLKTNSACFCKKAMHSLIWDEGPQPVERGNTWCVVAEVMVGGALRKVYGHAWNEPGTPGVPKKVLITTCGSTMPTDPHIKRQYQVDENNATYGEVVFRTVLRTQVIKNYFEAACQIDVHNHLRQGVMGIEDHVKTKNHIFRLFCTIVGMNVVDAYKIYNIGNKLEGGDGLMPFVEAAAITLLTNRLHGCTPLTVPMMPLRTRNAHVHDVDDRDDDREEDPHLHMPISVALYKAHAAGGAHTMSDRHVGHCTAI